MRVALSGRDPASLLSALYALYTTPWSEIVLSSMHMSRQSRHSSSLSGKSSEMPVASIGLQAWQRSARSRIMGPILSLSAPHMSSSVSIASQTTSSP